MQKVNIDKDMMVRPLSLRDAIEPEEAKSEHSELPKEVTPLINLAAVEEKVPNS